MPFQSPSPTILTTDIIVQAGETSDITNVIHEMGAGEQFQVYNIYFDIYPGNMNLGDIDSDDINEFTYTDIGDLYVETRDVTYAGFPLCCDPRPWEDLDLRIWVGTLNIPKGWIDISVFGGRGANIRGIGYDESPGVIYERVNTENTGKMDDEELCLPFPVVILGTQTLGLEVRNNNPVTAGDDTYSAVKITIVGEVVASSEKIMGEIIEK